MSNTILTKRASATAVLSLALLVSGCTSETVLPTERPAEIAVVADQVGEEPNRTGAPAQPPGGDEPSDTTKLIAMEDMVRNASPACRITFAYKGHEPETLIWSRETCAALTTDFVGQDRLRELRKWDRLDDHARDRISRSPDGEVLYVEGAFTASIYPLDFNNLTYEVTVAD